MSDHPESILNAAEKLFKQQGYHNVLLADVATAAKVPLPAFQTHFAHKEDLLHALLDKYSPQQEMQAVLNQIHTDTAEEMVRMAVRRLIEIFNDNKYFVDLALLDMQVNNGAYIGNMFTHLAGGAMSFVNRLSNMPGTRPISNVMLGRAFAAILVGFVITEQLAPRPAQFAMRIFPTNAWIDGIADIFLYGLLEDDDS